MATARLPIYLRRELWRSRREADFWDYLQAIVGRLGIAGGTITAKVHEGRVVDLSFHAVRLEGRRWPGPELAGRIERLLAGSRLRFGALTLRVKNGRLAWVDVATRLLAREGHLELLTELLYDGLPRRRPSVA